MTAKRRSRVLIYSPDSYGLGHLRRCLTIAESVAALPEAPSVLIATGSPRTQGFALPQGCDTVKLPALTKTPEGRYRSRTLSMPLGDVMNVRAELIRGAARSFRPDVILVDHAPIGVEGELEALFDEVGAWTAPPRMVLGLRDVIDDAEKVMREWARLPVWPALVERYDRILVYGDPTVPTTAQELGLPALFREKLRHVGYLVRRPPRGEGRRAGAGPSILVTSGGGGDGHGLLHAYADFLEALPSSTPFRSTVVMGPFLSGRRRREIAARFRGMDHPVELATFSEHFEELVSGATGVVAMAGYNTVVELLSARVPGLLVPRERPRREQRIRAERLARVADLEVCSALALDTARIGRFVRRVLASRPFRLVPRVRLDGLSRTAAELRALFDAEAVQGLRLRRKEGGVPSLA